MEKYFLPYDLSMELAKLKFNDCCFKYYSSKGKLKSFEDGYEEEYNFEEDENPIEYDKKDRFILHNGEEIIQNFIFNSKKECTAPLIQQAKEWLREKHNLLISPFQPMDDITDEVKGYYFEICKVGNLNVIAGTSNFQTYEEAELEAIRECIKIIKKVGKSK